MELVPDFVWAGLASIVAPFFIKLVNGKFKLSGKAAYAVFALVSVLLGAGLVLVYGEPVTLENLFSQFVVVGMVANGIFNVFIKKD